MTRLSFRVRFNLSHEILESRRCLTALAFVPHDLECCGQSADSIFSADLDGDGDADLLAAEWNQTTWRENLDGRGNFGVRQPLQFETFFEGNQASLSVADVDADSDPDILLSYSFDDQTISWFENRDGQGGFATQRLIATQNDVYEIDVVAADVNGDGHADVVAASSADEKIVWYQGDGNGAFGDQRDITLSDDDSASIAVVDLDGDGDLDVASASYYHEEIRWYANDGRGFFAMQPTIGSLQVDGTFIVDLTIAAEDMDGDGDLDLVLASSRHNRSLKLSTDQVAWYEHLDGQGKFSDQRVVSFRQGLGFGVAPTVADLDGDGDLDLAVTKYADGRVTWYENRIPGDSNNDGVFDSADLVAVFQSGEYEDRFDNNSTFDEGDWNGDGDFDSGDLVFAFQSGTYSQAAELNTLAASIDELFLNRRSSLFVS